MKAIQKIKSNLSKIINVLRHGILSLYSYIRKFIPWRSCTSTNSPNSSSSLGSSSSLNSSALSNSSISSYIRSLRHVRIAGMSASIMFGLLALAIIIPLYNVSGTEDTEAAVGTEVDSSISFTSTRNTASVAFNPTSTSGTFASSTAGTSDAAFSITTTNSQGYTLKLKSSNGTALKTSTSAANTATLSTISTSGITSSSFTTNTWGYLPSYYNSTTNTTKYYPATTSDVTLRTTTAANSTAHSYTIGIGAKADLTREAGTYTLGGNSSAMILSYAVNPTAYEIAYRDNSGDSTVANMPTTTQSGSVSATSIALAPNRTPTRTGYSLTGWCLGTVGSSGTTCTGTTIATNGTLKLDRTTSNSATLFALWTPNKYTCTKQYRLQNADGTWGSYTTDTTEQVDYNSTCSYSKTVTDYKGSELGANDSVAANSGVMNSTSGITLQVSLYRNTYALTVEAGSNTSNPTGSGTYRWGEVVPVGVTKATDITCIAYNVPTWTVTIGDVPSNGASTFYTMPTSNATVTATSDTSDIAQTVTLTRGTGASSIKIGSTNYTTSSASLACGSYTISGNYSSGYEFSSWSTSSNVSVSSTFSASTTLTVSGAGTLTLNAKSSKLYIQDVTVATCPTTNTVYYDRRDEQGYTIKKINGYCWMTKNLAIGCNGSGSSYGSSVSSKSLTSSNSNVSTTWSTPTALLSTKANSSSTSGYETAAMQCSSTYGAWYNYAAATAGTITGSSNSAAATKDICPAGWHLPTGPSTTSNTDFNKLVGNTTTFWQHPTTGLTAFSAVAVGDYYNGSLRDTRFGHWWSATASADQYRYFLYYDGDKDLFSGESAYDRYRGCLVRCVRTS